MRYTGSYSTGAVDSIGYRMMQVQVLYRHDSYKAALLVLLRVAYLCPVLSPLCR